MPPKRALWCRALVLLLLAGSLDAEEAELLLPGQSRERPIAAGEMHPYRVEVTGAPLLVTVEQRGIDLVVSARGTEEQDPIEVDAPNHAWGPEVLLLTGSDSENGHHLEIRSLEPSAAPGRYTIRVETAEEAQRASALTAMSRGSRATSGDSEALHQALSAYREALAMWRSLGERRWEAEALHAIAALELQGGELQAAAEDYSKAQALWRDLGDPYREAVVLGGIAQTRLRLGEIETSREARERALLLWQSLGERLEEGRIQTELCFLEQERGTLPAALSCYEEALALFRELGAVRHQARVLNNLGGIYDLLGEPDAALQRYEQALALRRDCKDRDGEAQTLINIGVLHLTLGEWQEALRFFGQTRDVPGGIRDRSLEGSLLSNIGYTYNSLGEPQRALVFLEEALALRRGIGDRRSELITRNNLGLAWRNLGDLEKALELHRQALELATALGDLRQAAVTHHRLAEAQLERGDPAAALRELEQSLPQFRQAGLRRAEAEALELRGRALIAAGRPQEALPLLQEVLAWRQTSRDRAGEASTLQALAAAERSLKLLDKARFHAEAAVARIEELRTGLASPDLRASFLATRRRAYALLIDLLMDRHAAAPHEGHDRAALAMSEQARARSLTDALLQPAAAGRAGSTASAGLLERRRSLRRRLSAKANQLIKQSERPGAETREREIEALQAELDGVEAEIRRQDPRYAAFSNPRPIGAEEIARLLNPGTLLLEYSLGEERSFLWAIGAGGIRSFVLPPQRKIESLARQVYDEMSTVEAGAARREKAAEALGRILLEPVWKEAASLQRLVMVPDAALHIVPFSALLVPEPGQGWNVSAIRKPLLEFLEVVSIPSATTLAVQQRRLEPRTPALKWAAVLADPVFSADDPRLSGPSIADRKPSGPSAVERGGKTDGPLPVFERLPASRREAEKIAALAPAGQQVWTALGFNASRDAVLSGELGPYRVVHFATHGVADARNPELSGLVLSLVDAAGRPRDGFLGLTDIYELDLGADLVVLSGCRTALGKEVRGEGLMGLTRGFLYAGVPRVVAGLWRVEDRTTTELMARFYRALWQQRLSPAAALREAQRSLRRHPRYGHPYSWAGFVLQGDWR